MSFNYNHITLVGRLTRDPEFKQLSETFCKLSFHLAVNRRLKKEDNEETDFIPISILGNLAHVGAKLLKKGSPALVWGRLQIRSYEKDEEKKWISEVVAENFQLLERFKKDTPEDIVEFSEPVEPAE